MKIETIVIATRNPAKVEHYRQALTTLSIKVFGLNDLEISGKPDEIGLTAEANAQIKAEFYSQRTNLPVLSEDESLWVDFLPPDQQPGTNVRRINGKDDATDDDLLRHWKAVISKTPEQRRTGNWHFAYCLSHQGKVSLATRDFPVRFYYPPSLIRIPGWPLSSIQGSTGKPSSERTIEEKQQSIERDAMLIRQIIRELVKD